jgi:hypothetical protein
MRLGERSGGVMANRAGSWVRSSVHSYWVIKSWVPSEPSVDSLTHCHILCEWLVLPVSLLERTSPRWVVPDETTNGDCCGTWNLDSKRLMLARAGPKQASRTSVRESKSGDLSMSSPTLPVACLQGTLRRHRPRHLEQATAGEQHPTHDDLERRDVQALRDPDGAGTVLVNGVPASTFVAQQQASLAQLAPVRVNGAWIKPRFLCGPSLTKLVQVWTGTDPWSPSARRLRRALSGARRRRGQDGRDERMQKWTQTTPSSEMLYLRSSGSACSRSQVSRSTTPSSGTKSGCIKPTLGPWKGTRVATLQSVTKRLTTTPPGTSCGDAAAAGSSGNDSLADAWPVVPMHAW